MAKRLYRNKVPPQEIKLLVKLKLPMLIEISSNNFEHIIQEAILKYLIKTNGEAQFSKIVTTPINKYLTIQEMANESINIPPRPDPNNLNDILEYNVLIDLQVDVLLIKHQKKIIGEVANNIKETIIKSKNTREPEISTTLINIITSIRNGIPQIAKDKHRAKFFEALLEKISKYPDFLKQKNKKKVGRPKKSQVDNYMDTENNPLDNFIIKNQN